MAQDAALMRRSRNPYVESSNGWVRDERLNIEELPNLTVAQVVVEAWRIEYNTYRPHSAFGGRNPAEYATNRASTTQPARPSLPVLLDTG